MKRLIALLLLSAPCGAAHAQDTLAVRTSGWISAGPKLAHNNSNSSKLTEYRDLSGNRFPLDLRINALRPKGRFLDIAADNAMRRDQSLGLRTGKTGLWRVDLGWDEVPHNRSNKTYSPYSETAPGVLDVAQVIAMPLKRLAPTTAQLPLVLRSDTLIAAFAQSFAQPVDLGTQSRKGTVGVRYDGIPGLDVSAGYTLRTKTGQHLSYGPIGDRPPRTLNIQFAEPVDYRTNDFKVGAEYNVGLYQLRAEYLLSEFQNGVDALTWRNVYATPPAGSAVDTWDRLVSAYGRKALAPDNRYHNATFTGGANLPLDSRLTASASFGRMRQNNALLPYSYAPLTTLSLPRTTANARMNTVSLSAEYAIVPVKAVSLRAFFRRFDLANETPSSQWQYVTSDVSNLDGSVTFLNKRVNEPIAWDRRNVGADATWRLGLWKTSLGLGFEREKVGRQHREVEETVENILRASWRVKPMRWLSVQAKYLRGDRDAGNYDWRSARESYWYTLAEAGTDNNNPQFTFENHPDMRRFDISDRRRDQLDLTAGLTPTGGKFSVSTTFKYRHDDFGSGVRPEQPLRGRLVADSLATTPGDQLGLLNSQRRQLGFDLLYAPVERFSANASLGWDAGDAYQRGLEFNENNKQNPSAIATATLGPWTRAGNQWTAKTVDNTRYVGVGGTYGFRSNVTLSANYTLSLSMLDIEYAGFGLTNFDGSPLPPNNEFAFQTPPTAKHRSQAADLRLEFPVVRDVTMRLVYMYDEYRIRDWQQDPGTAQFESVNTELLLRDTSRSVQWGNRLFNMGSLLAPDYTAHIVHVGLTYHF